MTASTEDGVAMAIEHKTLPVGGVQFHPESLMSLGGEVGLRIVENAFRLGVPELIEGCKSRPFFLARLCDASRSLSSGSELCADPLLRNAEG